MPWFYLALAFESGCDHRLGSREEGWHHARFASPRGETRRTDRALIQSIEPVRCARCDRKIGQTLRSRLSKLTVTILLHHR